MRVSKQKMPHGKADSDKASMYAIRSAISGPRRTVNVPVMSTQPRTVPVTLARAPWEVRDDR